MKNRPRSPANGNRTEFIPFPDTRWSLIQQATRSDEPAARKALNELCEIYWYPVYCFFRQQQEAPANAEDLTQEFFSSFLRRSSFDTVSDSGGKLRTFIRSSARNYLASDYRKRHAQKRGGGIVPLSIDFSEARDRFGVDPPDSKATPDEEFDRAWARTIFFRVQEMLEAEYQSTGKESLFSALKPWLEEGSGDPPYLELSRTLKASAGSLRVALFRLRQRYRSQIKSEISETLSDHSDLKEEVGHLLKIFQD